MDIRNFLGKPKASGSGTGTSTSASSATNTNNSVAASSRAAAVPTKKTKGQASPKKEESVIDLIDSDSDMEAAVHSKKRKGDQSKSASKTSSSSKRFAGIETPKLHHPRPFNHSGDGSDDGGGKQSAAAATTTTTSASSRTTNRANVVTTSKKQPPRQDSLNLSSGSSDSDSDEEDELKDLDGWPYIDQKLCKRLIASMSSMSSRIKREIIEGDDQRLCGENASYMQCIEVMRSDGSGRTLKYPKKEHQGKPVALHIVACAAHNGPRKKHQTASHRCQNDRCINGSHLTWESLDINESRKKCRGFTLVGGEEIPYECPHIPRCMNFLTVDIDSVENADDRNDIKNAVNNM